MIAGLVVINVALVGYDEVTEFANTYPINDTTKTAWNKPLLPLVGKVSYSCNPRVISVGDTLKTNNGLFEWRVTQIPVPSPNATELIYKGVQLDSCDNRFITLTWDLRTHKLEAEMEIHCHADKIFSLAEHERRRKAGALTSLIATTSLQMEFVPLIIIDIHDQSPVGHQYSFQSLFTSAFFDIIDIANTTYHASNFTSPFAITAKARAKQRPLWLLHNNYTDQVDEVPELELFAMNQVTNTGFGLPSNLRELANATFYNPLFNMFWLLHYATRLDLGNFEQRNFLAKPWVGPDTLVHDFAHPDLGSGLGSTSSGLEYRVSQSAKVSMNMAWNDTTTMVLPPRGSFSTPAIFEGTFECKAQRLKSPGFIFVAVMAGTFSMFATMWTVFMFIATYIEKWSSPEANYCEAHWNNPASIALHQDPEKSGPDSSSHNHPEVGVTAGLLATPLPWPIPPGSPEFQDDTTASSTPLPELGANNRGDSQASAVPHSHPSLLDRTPLS
ncbi:hypothetical protein CC2G_007393 [Coprinopsis cinerea AmutBmut pab1-1]|nr:hypothetical protein CC2G_007393 [Coprinopsis cinerea AmutBmut pab1-1]